MFWLYVIIFCVLVVGGVACYFGYAKRRAIKNFGELDVLSQQVFIDRMHAAGLSKNWYGEAASKKMQAFPEQLFDAALAYYYTKKDYDRVLSFCNILVEQDYADAFYLLGELHAQGRAGFEFSPAQAQVYYLQAAEKGSICGQYAWSKQILVDRMMEGLTADEMEATDKRALEFMFNAAEHKNAEACFWLAMQYLQGHYGLSVNYQKARDLLEVVVQQKPIKDGPIDVVDLRLFLGYFDVQTASYVLGLYHVSRLASAINYQKAESYFKQSVSGSSPEIAGFYALGKLYDENKLGLSSEKAKPLAIEHYKRACHFILAYFERSVFIEHLTDVNIDELNDWQDVASIIDQTKYDESTSENSSMEEIEALANEGHCKSQFILGRRYLQGDKTDKDEAKAAYWLEKAVAQGHMEAQYLLACLEPDEDKSLRSLKTTADKLIVDYMADSPLNDYGFSSLEQGFLPQAKKEGGMNDQVEIQPPLLVSALAENYIKEYIALKNESLSVEEGQEEREAKIADCLAKLAQEPHPEANFYIAVEHYDNQNYEAAFKALARAHKQGSKHCFYLLGTMYFYGHYVNEDDNRANQYYEQGAKLGCCYAQYELGQFKVEHRDYLNAAVNQNHLSAISSLANNYVKGTNGYPLDYVKAYYWYNYLSGLQQTTLALFDTATQKDGVEGLGFMYLQGLGRTKNFARAAEHFERAGFSHGLYVTANLYYGDFLQVPRQEALEKAAGHYEKVCSHYLDMNDFYLGLEPFDGDVEQPTVPKTNTIYYDNGTHSQTPTEELLVLAEKGYHKSQYNLAQRYADSKLPIYDLTKAAHWFAQAAEGKHERAAFELGKYHLYVKKDVEKACELLKPIADTVIEKYYAKNKFIKPKQLFTIDELKILQQS